ncbi:Nn.00g036250.m01.CDS01 [Neocucurbitaria sp. VM-36]
MVATRRGAKKAPEAAPAPSNTLNAPPKRGGRKKAVVEEATEPAPAVAKPTKATAAKRKAKSELEDAEPPRAKKPAANSKATRATKAETKAEPAPAVAKRATRGRKIEEPAVIEEPVIIEEAPKPTATRGRKAPAKKAPAPKVEEPAMVEEPVAEEAPKPASRARKAPTKKAPVTKKVDPPVIEKPVVVEHVKPAPRGRKAAAPKLSAPAPVIASRATRGRNVAVQPQDSPLKAPARKPTRKAAPVAETKVVPEPVEEPFAQYPGYPTTPAHIAAPLTARQAMRELPQYPNTPAHILAPISTKDALSVMPGYPKTPSHIIAPMTTKAALAEMPGYPKTPAHIKAPISVQDAMAEMPPDYPKTPAHIVAQAATDDENVMEELPDYPNTPAHITAPITSQEAMKELPDYPETPAHITVSMPVTESVKEHPTTPAHVTPPHGNSFDAHAAGCAPTPYQNTPPAAEVADEFSEASEMTTNITWGVTDQEAFEELPAAYPTTPAHIAAPLTSRKALAELPEYPKTPAHIAAPITPRRAFAELPDYPTTPAMAIEAAIQEEIHASVKKQTPSPLQFPTLEDVSFQFADTSEYTDVDPMEIVSETPAIELGPNVHLAPPQLTASLPPPDLASPKKSALRSPQKFDAKTPKKAVTWDDPEESELFMYDGPLQGMTFYVDVTSNGKDQNYLFSSLLEDLGAKVVKDLTVTGLSHVLYKDGNKSTLEKVLGSKGAIKCVNVGWVLDSEKNRMRMDEAPYLVDLSIAMPTSPLPTTTMKPFTPARTPSRYALPPSSECKSVPTTPTSSEFDRSINYDDKENCEHGVYFDCLDVKQVRTVPQKKSTFLFSRSPIKTPSKPSFLMNTPVKPMSAIKPFSTGKKRSAESSFPGISMAPPKRLRLF